MCSIEYVEFNPHPVKLPLCCYEIQAAFIIAKSTMYVYDSYMYNLCIWQLYVQSMYMTVLGMLYVIILIILYREYRTGS